MNGGQRAHAHGFQLLHNACDFLNVSFVTFEDQNAQIRNGLHIDFPTQVQRVGHRLRRSGRWSAHGGLQRRRWLSTGLILHGHHAVDLLIEIFGRVLAHTVVGNQFDGFGGVGFGFVQLTHQTCQMLAACA